MAEKTLRGEHWKYRAFPKFQSPRSEESSKSLLLELAKSTLLGSLMELGLAPVRVISSANIASISKRKSTKMDEITWWQTALAVAYVVGMYGFARGGLKHFPLKATGFQKVCLFILTAIFWLPVCIVIFVRAFFNEIKPSYKRAYERGYKKGFKVGTEYKKRKLNGGQD